MFSYVTKDVPAFVTISGRPAEPRGINAEGLKRRNFTADQIRNIREAYRVVYRQELKLDEAIAQLTLLVAEQPEIKPFVDSLRDGSRGCLLGFVKTKDGTVRDWDGTNLPVPPDF